MSELKFSQSSGLDDNSLNHLVSCVLQHKKKDGSIKTNHVNDICQSWLKTSAIQLPKYIYKHLLNQSTTLIQQAGNRIQSKLL
jgi:hypothetical protein